jgi:hypothetical protein
MRSVVKVRLGEARVALRGGWRDHAFLSSLSAHMIDHLACIRGVICHIGQRLGRMVNKLTIPEKLSDSFIP